MLFLAALVCGIMAALAAVAAIRGYLELSPVVVAAKDLKPGQVVGESDVKLEHVPARLVPAGAAKAVQEVVGRATASYLAAGAPVPGAALLPPAAAGAAGKLRAHPGRLAVALDASTATTVGGSLKEGDRVVVYATAKQGEAGPVEIARDVPVLSAPAGGQPAAGAGAVVLALTGEEAQALLAARAKGHDIALALEPAP